MKVTEAIKQLESGTTQNRSTHNQLLREAIKLGIEALKVIKDVRPTDYQAIDDPLPGETPEEEV